MKWPQLFTKKENKQATPASTGVETKSVLGTSTELGSFLIYGSDGYAQTPASAIQLYEQSTAVSIPINFIADSFSCIDPIIKIDGKVVTEHPILDLLRHPSPFFTTELFLEAIAKMYLVTGECFVAGLGNVSRPPLEIQPISPSNLMVQEGNNGIPVSWLVSGKNLPGSYRLLAKGRNVRYLDGPLREIKHIRNFSTLNDSMLRGQSLLVAASEEARQNILGNRHNVSLLEKGGRVSLVFHFQEDMEPTQFERVRDRVMDRYSGPDNAGAIGVTAGGKLDIKEVGTNNKDMDFAVLQEMAKQAVALTYKVPLPLISNTASTFNNYKEAKLALYDDAVLPLADRLFAGLTSFLVPRYNLDPSRVKIGYDMDQITALAVRRNEELALRKSLQIESDNELRALIGRDPYPEGDVIYKPANLVPAGTDLFGARASSFESSDEDSGLMRDQNAGD